MNDKAKILAGLILFVALAAFPIWYALAAGEKPSPPKLEPPKGDHCVEDADWMTAYHMVLLNNWRNAVVREGKSQYTSIGYKKPYEMSLTKTCMGCHTSREKFCYQCHEYANVKSLHRLPQGTATKQPQRGIRCWDCHVEPEGD